MNLTRLREDLGHFVHRDGHSELERVLKALEDKEAELQRRLAEEQLPHRRRHLEIELEVVRAQHSKGVARHLDLKTAGS
jgi:hypothetical protein